MTMKKTSLIIPALVLSMLVTATPALASTTTGTRNLSRLQFSYDYARAIDTFQIDGRTFLVQADPKTPLEIATKVYWLQKKLTEQKLAELLKTY